MHLSANRGGLGGENKNHSREPAGRLFGEAPHRPACWIRSAHKAPSPAEVPLKTFRPFIFWKQNCPCTAQHFQEAAVAFRGGSDLSSHHFTEHSGGGGSLCCAVQGGRRMQSHQITKTSAVFLLLRTITIGTTSCCYHGNRAVPSAQ